MIVEDYLKDLFSVIRFKVEKKDDDKKNIICFIHEYKRTGAPLVLLETCKTLRENLYNVFLIGPKKKLLSKEFEKLNVNIIEVDLIDHLYFFSNNFLVRFFYMPVRIFLNFYLQVLFLIYFFKIHPDLIYLNSVAARFSAMASKIYKAKVIWHIHEVYADKQYISKLLKRFISFCADLILVFPEYSKNIWSTEKTRDKFLVVELGSVKRDEIKIIDYTKRSYDLAFLGRFSHEKGFDTLIKSLAHFEKEERVLNVAFIGNYINNDFKTFAEDFIKTKLSKHKIDFYYDYQNPFEIMSNSKILVMPSRNDAFGRVIMEGMACMTTVIATRVGGIPEFVKDNQTGMLFDIDNDFELYEKIKYILLNETIGSEIAENGYKLFLNKFSLEKYHETMSKIIKTII